jgi:quercetin dioxygenase-like cupin family protein
MRVIRADEGETVERSAADIFEGGEVWGRALSEIPGSEHLAVSMVQFAAGARARNHTHTSDQILYVVAGIGKVGNAEGEQVVSAGDCIVIPAGEVHWHGAHDTGSPMSHLAIMAAGSESAVV